MATQPIGIGIEASSLELSNKEEIYANIFNKDCKIYLLLNSVAVLVKGYSNSCLFAYSGDLSYKEVNSCGQSYKQFMLVIY